MTRIIKPSCLFAAAVAGLLIVMVSSCSKQPAEVYAEVYSGPKDVPEMLSDMLGAKYADIDAMARMLDTTPSVVLKLKNSEMTPGKDLEERIRQDYAFFLSHESQFYALRVKHNDISVWEFIIKGWKIIPEIWWTIVIAWVIIIVIGVLFYPPIIIISVLDKVILVVILLLLHLLRIR